MAGLNEIRLYRMTHIENIPHILRYGITRASSPNANPNYLPIGDTSIIDKRNSFVIPNDKMLGQYIPFYFDVRMPMLYVIQNGYSEVAITRPENIVYTVTNIQLIIDNKLPFVFSDGHAVSNLSSFYDEISINNIVNILDFNAIYARYWKDENDSDLKRRKEAEFLVEADLPVTALLAGLYVYNDIAKANLINMGVDESLIYIDKNCYF